MLLGSGRNDLAGFTHEESACTAGPNIDPKKPDNASYSRRLFAILTLAAVAGSKLSLKPNDSD